LHDHPDYVTIIRERHAFEGQTLAVISSIKRRGVLLVLVILPNGSRSLIPASWTDWIDHHTPRHRRALTTSPTYLLLVSSVICFSCARSSTLSSAGISSRHHTWRAAMQLNLFLDPSDLPSSPTSSSPPQGDLGSTRRDRADRCARTAGAPHRAR